MKGIRILLERLKLQLHPEKTKLVCLWEGQEGSISSDFTSGR